MLPGTGATPSSPTPTPRTPPYPLWNASTNYPAGYKVAENGEIYQAKWVNQGVSPATESTDPSGSAWKALYSIPGEPSAGARLAGRVADRLVGLIGRERQPVPGS